MSGIELASVVRAVHYVSLAMEQYWAPLVPELRCSDVNVSERFWCDVLGFEVRFRRTEDRFVYVESGDVQVMLEERDGTWETGAMERPFGRGINLQIEVEDVEALHERVRASGVDLFAPLRRNEYRGGERTHVAHEFLVQDPDGYLLRFVQNPDA